MGVFQNLVGIFCILLMIAEAICPPLKRQCGCRITQADSRLQSLKADCSNSPELDLACVSFLQPESLDLSFNGLEKVPAVLNTSRFENLKHLDLSWNEITSLTSYNFGNRSRLKSLNISHNNLADLPKEKPLRLSIDVSYNKLTDMSSLFGLVNTNATVRGNKILCKCNSSHVNRWLNQIRTERLHQIECILHDKDEPKPIKIQCFKEIDRAEKSINNLKKGFIIFSIIITVFFIILFFLFKRMD